MTPTAIAPALSIVARRSCTEVVNAGGATVGMFSDMASAEAYVAEQSPASAPAPTVEQAAHSAKAQALAARSLRLGASRVAVPSQSRPADAYEVIHDSTGYVCRCASFSYRGRCIHQEAAAIVLEAEQAQPSSPRPVKHAALAGEVAALDAAGISNVGASLLGW